MQHFEQEFERRLSVHEQESAFCAIFAYTEFAVHHQAANDQGVFERIDAHAGFWNSVLAGLQTAAFIALGRIYDTDRKTDNAHELLKFAQTNHGIFSRAALAARKTGKGLARSDAQQYAAEAFEPGPQGFVILRRALEEHAAIYTANVQELRHKMFAHAGRLTRQRRHELLGGVFWHDLEQLVVFPLRLHRALFKLYHDGIEPLLDDAPTLIEDAVAPVPRGTNTWAHRHAASDAAEFLASLPPINDKD